MQSCRARAVSSVRGGASKVGGAAVGAVAKGRRLSPGDPQSTGTRGPALAAQSRNPWAAVDLPFPQNGASRDAGAKGGEM